MILQVFEPGIGGVLSHVAGITEHLIHCGRPIAVAFSSCRKDPGLTRFANMLNELEIPNIDMRVRNQPGWRDAFALSRLAKFCQRVQPRLIHCHSSKAGMLGRVLAAWRKVPVVYTPHAYFGLQGERSTATVVSNFLERNLGRVGHTVACSSEEREFAATALRISRERIVEINNGVDFNRFISVDTEKRSALRAKQNLPEGRFVVASICRLEYQKDPLSLIQGFAIAHAQCPSLYLHLVGRGSFESIVRREIENRGIASHVTWNSFQPKPHEVYMSADAYVSTSRYEGLPIVVLEALASNLPLVLTACPGHLGFSEIGLNRLEVIDVDAPDQLARCILRLYQQRDQPANHREVSIHRYSHTQSLNRTVSLYDQLLGANEG